MDEEQIRLEACAIKVAINGPLGPVSFQRVIRERLRFFRALRQMGCTWIQIAALMHSVGVRNSDGKPMSAAHWRALVSRAGRNRPVLAASNTEVQEPAASKNAEVDKAKLRQAKRHSPEVSHDRDVVRSRMAAAKKARECE